MTILVAAGFTGSCGAADGTGASLTGSVRVTITGLSADAEDGGTATISALDTQNFLPITVVLPVNGETGNVPDIPVGNYRVSYAPPSDHAIAAGETNPKNAQVRGGEQTTVSWAVVAAEGTVRITVIGLESDASDGGSATVHRTDILGQPPVTLPIPLAGAADLDVLAGTYAVTYTPPSGYTVASGISNPQDVTATHGAVGEVNFAVAVETFEEPDILNNASFESGWDGFMSGGSGNPTGVSRSTDRAFDGNVALKFTWTGGGGERSAQVFYNIGSQSHFWTRVYYYFTAVPNGTGFKFIRYQDVGFYDVNGVQLDGFGSPELIWLDKVDTETQVGATIQPGGWHSLEYEWDVANKELRFWIDGVSVRGSGSNGQFTWSGDTLHYSTTFTPRWLDIIRVINAPNNSGAIYIDRVSVSSRGRIGS